MTAGECVPAVDGLQSGNADIAAALLETAGAMHRNSRICASDKSIEKHKGPGVFKHFLM